MSLWGTPFVEDKTAAEEINPNDSEIYYYRSQSYKALGNKEKSCNDLKKSNELGYMKANDILKKMPCN